MRPLTVWLCASAGVALLCACGCFGPMYNPNGPWGAPGYSQYNYPMNGYPGSIQTLTPGPQYVPGNSVTPGSGVQPTPTYGGGNAAPYNGETSPTVPNPSDPNSPYFPSSNEQFNRPRSGASAPSLDDAPPFSSVGGAPGGDQLSAAALQGPALRPAGLSRAAQPPASAATPGQYGHDAAGYAWLEGVVSYDAADQTWNIVYNLNPDATDEYAGHFTLGDTPLSRTFREGERVRLEGRVDQTSADRRGKPTYLPERVIRDAA